jgi:hypothetical protein
LHRALLVLLIVLLAGTLVGAGARAQAADGGGARRDAAALDAGDAGRDGASPPDGRATGPASPEEPVSRQVHPRPPEETVVLPIVPPRPAGAPPEDEPRPRIAASERPVVLLNVVIGLLTLLVLAYLAGHPRVQRLEELLGISQVITAGFPFVLLGLIARQPRVGILTEDIVVQLSPVLGLGLGWIGFVLGFRFDARLLDRLPPQGLAVTALITSVPFFTVLAASGLLLMLASGLPEDIRDPVFLRDAIILGTAGAMSGPAALRFVRDRGSETARVLARLLRLEELAGIAGLAVVAAYFRPAAAGTWQLPGTAWLFLTLGLGAAAGLLMYALLRRARASGEVILLTLGALAFAAGFAGTIRLSPLVVCFVMGLLVGNAPGAYKGELGIALRRLERPMYFLFLLIVGALWSPGDWRGWVLMVVFVTARLLGRWSGLRLGLARAGGAFSLAEDERRALLVAPLGALSLAIVINAQMLYPGGSISLIVTAIVGGAVFTEVLVQLANRRRAGALVGEKPAGPEAPGPEAPGPEAPS